MTEIVSYDPEEPEADPLLGYLAPPELPYANPPADLAPALASMRSRWLAQPAGYRDGVGTWERRIGVAAVLAMLVGAASSDVRLVLALALVAALAGARHLADARRWSLSVVLYCGLLAIAAAAYEIRDVVAAPAPAAIEWGLLLALTGAVALSSAAYAVGQRRED